MITIEQFHNHKLWGEFSRACQFREPKGYHYPEDNPDDACVYTNPKTGGGIYANCCFTACMSWLDQLSEPDRVSVLREMEEGEKWLVEQERREAGGHVAGAGLI